MRLAIFGDHPDGWRMAEALRASGHQIVAYAGPTERGKLPVNWPGLRVEKDPEELLADPQIEAVIVASPIPARLDHLRRVLQSERSALCVHPVDARPDGGYEIHMLQGDVHQVALPIMPEAYSHEIASLTKAVADSRVLSFEAPLPTSSHAELSRPEFPGWTLLRRIGGEIVEIAALAPAEELTPNEPIVGVGRFQNGKLLHGAWLTHRADGSLRVGWLGQESAVVTRDDAEPWFAMVARFEEAIARLKASPRVAPGSGPAVDLRDGLGWNDEIRALELNDLARRSIERRRAYSLDFQEATEEVGFKGTMTLVGCALLWVLIPIALLLVAWKPAFSWLIVGVLVLFLALQLLKGSGEKK